MKTLLNTLFVTSDDVYLSLDGENVVANQKKEIVARYPLHILSGIITFSYSGASPALMGACAKRNITLAFCSPQGRFLAQTVGENNGNVLLRRIQYRKADIDGECAKIAKNMIIGKVFNTRTSLERTKRDHSLRVNIPLLTDVSQQLQSFLSLIQESETTDALRGLEGAAAQAYFKILDQLILGDKKLFSFTGRNRRPPQDPVNALLSLSYSLLSFDCCAGLTSVGLDAYVGFLHKDKPGRASLALDLMEELRPCFADRFVLKLINNRIFHSKDFIVQESGAVLLTDDGRRAFFKHWQNRKKEIITHPYLKEKMPWGLIPYIQALLLARYLRGDIDEYPPFLWQ